MAMSATGGDGRTSACGAAWPGNEGEQVGGGAGVGGRPRGRGGAPAEKSASRGALSTIWVLKAPRSAELARRRSLSPSGRPRRATPPAAARPPTLLTLDASGHRHLRLLVRQKRRERIARQRAREEVPLRPVAAELAQALELHLALDALGDDLQAQRPRDLHDGGDDRGVLVVGADAVDERAVDFDDVERE